MPQLAICNIDGEKVGQVELSEEIFGVPLNEDLVHQAVVVADSGRKRHAGNAKRRAEVVTTGAKMWRQKGTGRARHGDKGAPIFVGGGKAHAPKFRDGGKKMPRKMRRKALFCALSDAARRGQMTVIEDIELEKPRTKTIVGLLEALRMEDAVVMLMLSEQQMADEALVKSCRNIEKLHLRQSPHLNTRDVLWAGEIVFTQEALAALNQLSGGAE
jgi:large subunit ribosomal protein L4